MKNRLRAFALVATVVLGAAAAHAQQTSESPAPPSAAADRSVATAAPDAAPERTVVGTARDWIKESQIIGRIEGDVDGWYPRIGGITRGSGFALGPGYRLHGLDNHLLLDVSAGLSVRLYKAFDVRARWLQAWHERAEVWTEYHYEDFPQEDFYGIGPDTTEDRRTSYGFRSSDIVLRGQVKPKPWLRVGASLGYLNPTIGPGRDREFPSIEQLFTDISVPGLASQPNFLHAQLFTEIDYRDAGGNPKSGGFYRGAYGSWNDRTFNLYDFRRFDGNAAQYRPLTRDRKHVISGKVGVSFVNNAPGNRVPFYFLPYVGGQDSVRSYPEFRFKDENALWFGGEYRWIPITWVSAAVFADFGKVAHDWQDINGSDLKRGYGFGVRFHSSRQTFAKVDFGFGGGEGWQAFLKLGPF